MKPIYIISHTHWDREWYRTFQQFRLRLVHLVDNVLAILEQDPNFKHFMLDGQTIVIKDYLEMRPENERKIQQHVQNGRLLIGPWYILPDEFLVSPEATLRNLIEGDRDCKQWGGKMNVGYVPDTFGHIGQLPQILRGFGFETASVWRGVDDQPLELWWQSPDGSRVFLANLRDGYGNGANLPVDHPESFTQALIRIHDRLIQYAITSHLLVMLGTDHMEPSPHTSKAIQYANHSLGSTRIFHSTLPEYLASVQQEAVKEQLPVIHGELRSSKLAPLLPGVLSTRMWIKQRNRACENLLERWAEPFSAWASLISKEANHPYLAYQSHERLQNPAEALRYAWRLLMQNHPHDSICGCSIDQVHDEMRSRFDQVEQIGEEVTRQSLEFISNAVATQEFPPVIGDAQAAIIAFNPAPTSQSGLVKTSLVLPQDLQAFELVDYAGNCLPYALGNRQSTSLFEGLLTAKDFKEAFQMIQNGKAGNMVVRNTTIERNEHRVNISLVMVEFGEPDEEEWKTNTEQLKTYLSDPAITEYYVSAHWADTMEMVFLARDVPACGYTTYWLRNSSTPGTSIIHLNWLTRKLMPVVYQLSKIPSLRRWLARESGTGDRPPYVIENDILRVEAAPDHGSLTLLDKRTGHRYEGLNRFVDGADCGDEYNYSPPAKDKMIQEPTLQRVKIEKTSLHQKMTLDLFLEIPVALAEDRQSRSSKLVKLPIQTQITLIAGDSQVNIHTEVSNTAKDHRLRVHFAVPFTPQSGLFDGHFEIVERSTDLPEWDESWVEQPRPEAPQRAFTAVQNELQGLMIANRGLPEVEVIVHANGGSEISITLLRCVGWLSREDLTTRKGHAGPPIETPGAQMLGNHSFDYAVIPYASGESQFLAACHQAYAFQTPMRGIMQPLHPGQLLPSTALLSIDSPKFIISAIKIAESANVDGQARWIARGYNLTNDSISVNFHPWGKPVRADLTTLSESPCEELNLSKNGDVTVSIGPHQIKTIQWTSGKAS
jgi:alpha-mannosidase